MRDQAIPSWTTAFAWGVAVPILAYGLLDFDRPLIWLVVSGGYFAIGATVASWFGDQGREADQVFRLLFGVAAGSLAARTVQLTLDGSLSNPDFGTLWDFTIHQLLPIMLGGHVGIWIASLSREERPPHASQGKLSEARPGPPVSFLNAPEKVTKMSRWVAVSTVLVLLLPLAILYLRKGGTPATVISALMVTPVIFLFAALPMWRLMAKLKDEVVVVSDRGIESKQHGAIRFDELTRVRVVRRDEGVQRLILERHDREDVVFAYLADPDGLLALLRRRSPQTRIDERR